VLADWINNLNIHVVPLGHIIWSIHLSVDAIFQSLWFLSWFPLSPLMSSFVLNRFSLSMSKSRYKYEADITCICGILYLKVNRIDAINSHQKLNYSVIQWKWNSCSGVWFILVIIGLIASNLNNCKLPKMFNCFPVLLAQQAQCIQFILKHLYPVALENVCPSQ
jgi:hypothetical protein